MVFEITGYETPPRETKELWLLRDLLCLCVPNGAPTVLAPFWHRIEVSLVSLSSPLPDFYLKQILLFRLTPVVCENNNKIYLYTGIITMKKTVH